MGGNKILPFCVFFLLMFSGHVFSDKSDKKSRPKTVLDDQVKSRQASETYPAIVNLYRPNYILPYYYTGSPYQEIYLFQTPNNQSLNHEELKAQLSFLVPIIHHLIENRPLALNFAYTQLMYWQVYAKSQYFRETNYEPELFIENYFNSNLAAQLGVNHQSNGRGGPLERSWNRAYLQFKFSGKNWLTHIRGWALLGQNVSSDIHNPDIAHFLGYENVLFSYNFMNLKASVELQNIESGLRRGFVQATLSYPILKSLSIYAQFFNGYGQSLIEYNHRTTSGGIGFALNDWIN
ncbi:MAG TPA: phospholipase A [Legionella sp.]|nr:phospholipase A [Legionella sp.]